MIYIIRFATILKSSEDGHTTPSAICILTAASPIIDDSSYILSYKMLKSCLLSISISLLNLVLPYTEKPIYIGKGVSRSFECLEV